jgi:hypothetical protein
MVRYGAGHSFHNEWVYNGADIDGSKVAWAHDMGAAENAELFRYFSGRQIWLIKADEEPAELVKYPDAAP